MNYPAQTQQVEHMFFKAHKCFECDPKPRWGFALYIQKRPHLEPLCSRVWWFFKCSFPKKNWQCLDAPASLGLLLYGLIDLFTLKIKLYLIRHQKYFKSKKGDSQNNKTNSISSPSQILWEIHHPVSFQSCKKCMLGRDWQSQKLDWFVGPLPFVSIRSQLVVTGPRESEKPFDSDFGKLDKNMEKMNISILNTINVGGISKHVGD